GNYQLTLTFKSGTNGDIALVNVQNALKRAESNLPSDVLALGVSASKVSTDMVAVYTFTTTGETLNMIQLANYVRMNVRDPLARLEGVNLADLLGAKNYAMRAWLDVVKLSALNISTQEVMAAIQSQNIQAAAGTVGSEGASASMQLKIDAVGRLTRPEDFADIVIRTTEKGEEIRLGDVAKLELGTEFYNSNSTFNGEDAISVALYRQSGANAIDIVDRANKLIDELRSRFPEGVRCYMAYDPTEYIRQAIAEIALTLIITLLLVVAITWVFLQNWRATLIPAIAIPVSLLGTFFFMRILDYSINTLTMFGLILVIGSLVDNAIVVVENTLRIMTEEKLPAPEATAKSMRQITGAIFATTLVTVAIYAPIGFYGGLVGTIYKQFSVTMCIALCLSAVNALTLSPALCSLLFRGTETASSGKKWWIIRFFEWSLDGTRQGYMKVSRLFMRRTVVTLILLAAVIGANYLLLGKVKSGFLPNEDKGALLCDVELPPGAALDRTDRAIRQISEKVGRIPGVQTLLTVSGFSLFSGATENVGFCIVDLKDWKHRTSKETSIDAIRDKVMGATSTVPDAIFRAFQPPAIMGLGNTGGVTFAFQSKANETPQQFEKQVFKLLGMLNNKKEFPDALYAFTPFNAGSPQYFLDIDRRKASALGLEISAIFQTLQSKLAAMYVNDFNMYGYSFQVKIQSDPASRTNLMNLENILFKNRQGEMVPLTAFATVKRVVGARQLTRFNQSLAAIITLIPVPGASSGNLMKKIQSGVQKNFSGDYFISWTDLSYQEQGNEGKIFYLMVLAMIFGYLFLVAQYESWTTPIPVFLVVLFATSGGLLALYLTDYALDIYAQMGLIMLLGLVTKSAILMVEFSKQERENGRSIALAALNGAAYRYRAVLMTAWSFIIGALPMLFASGAGSGARKVIGVTTFWGMFAATVVGVAFIPVLYAIFQKMRETFNSKIRRKK
ncbi:MAG: efflux RND transporter permease subunit, partial [Lentisphaeria bacterium]|nr:efflux RND transporter permease subunit [Lentisphaeria bacterium]